MRKPIAVCISDIHFSLSTLELATISLQAAIDKAKELHVSLIIAGDLLNDKAIIRGEVANRLIDIFESARVAAPTKPFIIVGNHDLINEKGVEHSLNFLRPYAHIVEEPLIYGPEDLILVPYMSNVFDLNKVMAIGINSIRRKPSIMIMHQGFQGAHLGDYVQDKTSINPDSVKKFNVISGHYHRHQTLGTVTYIGSPYTMSFGEANDGPKGFLVLYDDGSYTREILNLRKHVILEVQHDTHIGPIPGINSDDLLWLKVRGPESELKKLNKNQIGNVLLGHSDFKLDLIPTDSEPLKVDNLEEKTHGEVLDELVDFMEETDDQKTYLKKIWRTLV